MIPHWLWVFLGLNGVGPWYFFWSAIAGSFFFTLLFGGILYWWHHVCVEHRCFRVGRHPYSHPVTKAQVRACRKHHPDIDHTKKIHLHEWAKHR